MSMWSVGVRESIVSSPPPHPVFPLMLLCQREHEVKQRMQIAMGVGL